MKKGGTYLGMTDLERNREKAMGCAFTGAIIAPHFSNTNYEMHMGIWNLRVNSWFAIGKKPPEPLVRPNVLLGKLSMSELHFGIFPSLLQP